MIDTLKQYKVFGKFVEWMLKQHNFVWDGEVFRIHPESYYYIRSISDREFLSLLVEFCDEQGYKYLITNTIYDGLAIYSRTEATKVAIVKVFELINNNDKAEERHSDVDELRRLIDELELHPKSFDKFISWMNKEKNYSTGDMK